MKNFPSSHNLINVVGDNIVMNTVTPLTSSGDGIFLDHRDAVSRV